MSTVEVPTKPPAIVVLDETYHRFHWYHDTHQARYGQWVLMADHRGVTTRGYLHLIPPSWIMNAGIVFGALEQGHIEIARAIATHIRTIGNGLQEINHES